MYSFLLLLILSFIDVCVCLCLYAILLWVPTKTEKGVGSRSWSESCCELSDVGAGNSDLNSGRAAIMLLTAELSL